MVQSKKNRMNKAGGVNVKNAEINFENDADVLEFADYVKSLPAEVIRESLHQLSVAFWQNQRQHSELPDE